MMKRSLRDKRKRNMRDKRKSKKRAIMVAAKDEVKFSMRVRDIDVGPLGMPLPLGLTIIPS